MRLFAGMPEYELDVAGGGDLLEPLRKEFARCGWIRFSGPVPHAQLESYYSKATALILPSLAPEVFPLTILEAMACGTPVIVSNAGGSPEAVERSGAGFVYRSVEELQRALLALAKEPGLRETLSRRARAAYEGYYCEDRYVSQYLSIVEEQMQKRGNGRRAP